MKSNDAASIVFYLVISVSLVFGRKCPVVCYCKLSDMSTTCEDADLSELPEGIRPETLKLDLTFNKFSSIPQGLSDLKNLQYLDLSYNNISYLNQSSLEGLNNLTMLNLTYNSFSSWFHIAYQPFVSTPQLLELDLSHNNFGSLDLLELANDYPLKSSSIRRLSLSNCSMKTFTADFLNELPELEELYLSKNGFMILNVPLKSEKLRILDFSECNLQRIFSNVLEDLQSLEELKLSRNFFLKRFNCASSSLKYLDVSHGNLETLPNGRLNNLLKVNFQGNHLRHIPANGFKLSPDIRELILSNNAIQSIDLLAFQDLELIEYIDLSSNTITHLSSETFMYNTKLQGLNLSRNYLNDIGQLTIESLKWLDLSACEIRELPKDSLILMPKLERLNLSRNMIKRVANQLQGDKLNYLDLSRCGIYGLNNKSFVALHNLRTLNLAENHLTSGVRPEFFYSITDLNLESNPWLCDCDSAEFKELYDWLFQTATSTSVLRCRSPESLAGLTWEHACYNSWSVRKSMPHQMWIYSMASVLVMSMLCFVVVSIRHMHQRKLNRQRELEEEEREEARQRLREMQINMHRSIESVNRNAPDPREEQSPPSYVEAISMPRLNMSCTSLAGSHRSLYSIQSTSSQLDGSRKSKVRRKRRRRPINKGVAAAGISQSAASLSRANTDPSSSDEDSHRDHRNVAESNF